MVVGSGEQRCAAHVAGFADVDRVAEFAPACFPDCERSLGALGDEPPLLLRQRGVEVKHERVGVAAKFSDDERDTLGHQASNEGNITREAIQLRDHYAAFSGLRGSQCGGEVRASVESVGTLACFGFNVLSDDAELFGFSETANIRALRLDPKSRALLLPSRDTVVGNSAFHTKGIPPFALCMNATSEQ